MKKLTLDEIVAIKENCEFLFKANPNKESSVVFNVAWYEAVQNLCDIAINLIKKEQRARKNKKSEKKQGKGK